MTDQNTASANKSTFRKEGDREIVAERIFNAPPQKVYETMLDPELIPEWWGSREHTTKVEKFEARQGGDWHFVASGQDGEHGFRGTIRELVPNEKIQQTFEWLGMPGYVCVETATLEDLGDGRTKLVNVSLFHTTEERDGMMDAMEPGASETYDRLEELLAK
jgi:uncharacterized protein YndB with AHSA1/START domain